MHLSVAKFSKDNWFERYPRLTGLLVTAAVVLFGEGVLQVAGPDIFRFAHEARQVHEYDPAWGGRLLGGRTRRTVVEEFAIAVRELPGSSPRQSAP